MRKIIAFSINVIIEKEKKKKIGGADRRMAIL